MKKALVTETTDKFTFGTRLLLKSFFYHNNFDGDIVVMHGPGELCESNKNILMKEFDIIFHECTQPDIVFNGKRQWAHNPASRFDIFKLPYDQVIYYDSDVLILDRVDEFINSTEDFTACAYTHSIVKEAFRPDDNGSDCNSHLFNAGVMNIGKRYLNDNTYADILQLARDGDWPGNQGIFNKYFSSKCNLISNTFNLTVSEVNKLNLKRAKTLHFVGNNKIWNRGSYISKFDMDVILTIGLPLCTQICELYRNNCFLIKID